MAKKKVLVTVAIVVSLIIILLVAVGRDEPLNPSLVKDLAFKLPEVPPEDNAYVGLAGLRDTGIADVVAAGKEFLYRDPSKPFDYSHIESMDSSYKNPCLEPGREDCLSQLLADEETINEALKKNEIFLGRYRTVQKMPLFINTTTGYMSPVPMYQPVIESVRLTGTKALLDMKKNGRLADGWGALETDLNFYKMIYQSEQIVLIDLMIAVASTQLILMELGHVIGDDTIDISGYEALIRQSLELGLNPGEEMGRVLSFAKRQMLHDLKRDVIIGSFPKEDLSLKEKLRYKAILFLFKENMTRNLAAARYDQDIADFQATPILNFPDLLPIRDAEVTQRELSFDSNLKFKNLYKKYGLLFFKNYYGEQALNIAQPLYWRYMARMNDIIVYSHLLRAQLELRLMADRPTDISQALGRLGPETWNPYTGKPFNWDQEKNTIWAESASISASSDNQENAARKLEVVVPKIFSRDRHL